MIKFPPRQQEVYDMIVKDGWTNKDIALELGLKIHTVKIMVQKIFEKAQVNSRSRLIIQYWRNYYGKEIVLATGCQLVVDIAPCGAD